MNDVTLLWWTWIAAVSLQLALLMPAVLVFDRVLARLRWLTLQAALWIVVMVRLVWPPSLSTAFPPETVARMPDVSAFGVMPVSIASLPIEWLFAVWFAGVCVCGCWAIRRHRALCRLWTDGVESAPEAIASIARNAARRAGLIRAPRLVVHPVFTTPAVVGIVRPIVVLPRGLVRGHAGDDLACVLLHELAHIRRRDAIRAAAGQLLQVLYWFHPIAWAARARLDTLREIACDAEVVSTTSRDEYRRTLLRLARPLASAPHRVVPGLGLFEHRSDLLTRLSILERPGRPGPLTGRTAAAAVLAAGIVMMLAVDASTRAFDPDPSFGSDMQGCLRFRYAVFAALAREAAAEEVRSR